MTNHPRRIGMDTIVGISATLPTTTRIIIECAAVAPGMLYSPSKQHTPATLSLHSATAQATRVAATACMQARQVPTLAVTASRTQIRQHWSLVPVKLDSSLGNTRSLAAVVPSSRLIASPTCAHLNMHDPRLEFFKLNTAPTLETPAPPNFTTPCTAPTCSWP